MTRSMEAAVSTAAQQTDIRAALLAYFAFSSGDVRAWSGTGDLSFSGDTYQGVGNLGRISRVEETVDIRAAGLTFELSGVPSSLISIALDDNYQGRTCTLWMGLFDTDNALIADPFVLFQGRMDTMEIEDGGKTAIIRLTAENRLIDLTRLDSVPYYTQADQAQLYGNDRGLEYVPAMQEAVIVWGRATVGGSAPSGNNGGGGQGPSTVGNVLPPASSNETAEVFFGDGP